MSKTLKRTLAVVMAIAMIFALSATAFADNDQYSVTAYVRLQSADVPDEWGFTLGELENVEYITPYSQATGYFVPVTVTKSSPITVKDIVETLYGFSVVSCNHHDSYGCIHDDLDPVNHCTCSTCNCTWKKVADVVYDPNTGTYIPTGDYASALNSITYMNNTYTNDSVITGDSSQGTYEGTSWEYFVANNSAASAIYPESEYMDQYVVSSSVYITLSFDYSSFDWGFDD